MSVRQVSKEVKKRRQADRRDDCLAQNRLLLRQKLLRGNIEVIRNAMHFVSSADRMKLKELEDFARFFKTRRLEFGFTQGDVGTALGQKYNADFSQTTVSRFESLNLSFKNMCKLYSPLNEWLSDVERALADGVDLEQIRKKPNGRSSVQEDSSFERLPSSADNLSQKSSHKRRKRTNLSADQRSKLRYYFEQNQHPDNGVIVHIAETLALSAEVVKVWFCNHRQKLRTDTSA